VVCAISGFQVNLRSSRASKMVYESIHSIRTRQSSVGIAAFFLGMNRDALTERFKRDVPPE